MFNPWYRCNEVDVGPLGENNELTLDVREFQRYTNLIKSQKRASTTQLSADDNSDAARPPAKKSALPNYLLNEFLIGKTRLNYFDERNYIGVASRQYASPVVLQNLERMVVHQDIGYYFLTTAEGGDGLCGAKRNEEDDPASLAEW